MANTKIWCGLIDHEKRLIGSPICVYAECIAGLKKEVKRNNLHGLDGVDPGLLVVWRSKKTQLSTKQDVKTLRELIRSIELYDEDQAVELHYAMKLVELELDEKEILLVQTSNGGGGERGSNSKRKHEDFYVSELDQRKRNKLATEAPSMNGKASEYALMQQSADEAILDDRPEADSFIPPLSLLYDGFGLFEDIVKAEVGVDGLTESEQSAIRMAVDKFADEMCRIYNNDDERRDAGLPLLNKILGAREWPIPFLHASSIVSVRDGHFNGPHGMASMLADFKNWTTDISSLPEPQLVSYFAHSQKTAIKSSKDQRRFRGWRIPCLGISVIGSDVRFYAMLTLAGKFRLVGLTSLISCLRINAGGADRQALRTAFIAASVLLTRICDDVNHHLTSPTPIVHHDTEQPYLPAVTNIGAFKIYNLVPWDKPQASRYIYHAQDQSGKSILVTFTLTYSAELHEFCASRGHAPALLACERLPGRWYGVAMEYLPDIHPVSLSPSLSVHRQQWEVWLRELVTSIHEHGMVHGDLRDANIVCNTQGRLWLIDFDWGGREDTAVYPTLNLHEELRRGGSEKITKEDDTRVLNITLRKMDENLGLCSNT